MDDQQSLVQRLRELAVEQPDAGLHTHLAVDGTEQVLTSAELDARSSQLAGAMAAKGVGIGDRVALGLRNSPELVIAAFAGWKVGATPIPVRWDLPEWERAQLREVIDARIDLGDDDLAVDPSTTDADPIPDLPDVLAPRMMGICSSGSTGTPKIIVSALPAVFHPVFSTPMMEQWRPVSRPQQVLVLAPMYHVNAFATLHNLLAGDRLVVLEKFDAGARRRRHRAARHHVLHRDADDAATHRRPPGHRRARPVERRLDPAGRRADATVARASLGRI